MRATLARCVGTMLLVGASCIAKSVVGPEEDPAFMGRPDLTPVSMPDLKPMLGPPDLLGVDARLPEPMPDLRPPSGPRLRQRTRRCHADQEAS